MPDGDWLVPTVVLPVDDWVPSAVSVELPVESVVVSEPSGVAPPPPLVTAVPPVDCEARLVGIVTTVVDVVTVVGIASAAAGATRTCGRAGVIAAAGAASSGGFTLEYATGAAVRPRGGSAAARSPQRAHDGGDGRGR